MSVFITLVLRGESLIAFLIVKGGPAMKSLGIQLRGLPLKPKQARRNDFIILKATFYWMVIVVVVVGVTMNSNIAL